MFQYHKKNRAAINRKKCNLSYLILFTVTTVLFIGINLLTSQMATAQTSLIPALSLQRSQFTEVLASEVVSLPPEVKSAVLNDAVKRTNKTVSAMNILEVKPQQWSDGCLGLGKAEEICIQAITPGYKVVVTDGLRNWTYRTDDVGNVIRLE